MDEYLEDYDNIFVQVFYEFCIFLYLVNCDCKGNRMLHNIMLDSMKIHMRALCDFFSDCRTRTMRDDDLIYPELINSQAGLDVSMPKALKNFINKGTAHITKKRGKIELPKEEFVETIKSLIRSIEQYINELDSNLRPEYQEMYSEKLVKELRCQVFSLLMEYEIKNAHGEDEN